MWSEAGRTGGPAAQTTLDGAVEVTEADVEHFMAVQKQVERRRRIAAQTRNMMRRTERHESEGEIRPLDPAKRDALKRVLHLFVTKQDNLITLYVRDPPPEIDALTPKPRRDRRAEAGHRSFDETRQSPEALLGPQDARTVVEKTLRKLFGVRRNNLPSRGAATGGND